MFPIIQLGPLAVQVPGLLLLAGLWVGLSLTEKEAARLKQNPERVYTLAFAGLVAGLIGARLWYASQYLSLYAASPLALLSLNPSTLNPAGGLAIGIIAAAVYASRKRMPARLTLDALAPGLATLGIALALAHWSSGDAFGAPARLPWSIFLWDDYRHPSQVYELIAALAVLGIWRWRRDRRPFDGAGFLLVFALSASSRVFLEAFRGDSLITFAGLRTAQLWGLAAVAASLAAMDRWGRAAGEQGGGGTAEVD